MNKTERKRRARERKRKTKLAKRAKREADGSAGEARESAPTTTPHNSRASEGGEQATVAEAPVTPTPESPSVPRQNSGQATSGKDTPTQDDLYRAHAKLNWAEADMLEGELAAKLGDDEAVELLSKAARALGDVIDYVQDLLECLPKEQVAEAIRIQNAPRTYGQKSRNGANPVVQLLNILLRAKGLMIRVVKQTNPELARRMKAKL